MDFQSIMQEYFRGERIEALYYILPAGLLLIGLALTALATDRGAFGWSMAIPLALFGLVAIGTGATVGLRTPAQLAGLEQGYSTSPTAMLSEELPRMEKVNATWPIYLGTWTVLAIIGLGLRFGLHSDWAQGLGPALILIGAAGFLIDGFAERRARPYTAALETLAAEHGVTSSNPVLAP